MLQDAMFVRAHLTPASALFFFTYLLASPVWVSSHQRLHSAVRTTNQFDVSMAEQRKEGRALLALKKALKNHPVFKGFTPEEQMSNPDLQGLPYGAWTMTQSIAGMPGNMRVPCSAAQWAWVGCDASQRVVSVNLGGFEIIKLNRTWIADGKNPITGSIPWAALAPLKNLNFFDVGYQSIKGSLKGVGNLPALRNLSVLNNGFSGQVPDEVSKLKSLLAFRAGSNRFTSLPRSMSSMNKLAALGVCCNSFQGPFPAWIGNLANLQWLDLSSNPISGALPKSWSKLTKLTGLQLQFTTISGKIPSAWSGMRSLNHMGFIGTHLQSTIPDFIMKLPRVISVRLSQNKLYGPLPKKFIGKFMLEVGLDNNYLNGTAGPIPSNASPLLQLNLDINCFSSVTKDIPDYQPRLKLKCTEFYRKLKG